MFNLATLNKALAQSLKEGKRVFKIALYPILLQILRNKIVLLIGDGRSGTTWVSEVLNFDERFLVFFEPLHGRKQLRLTDKRLYPTEIDLDQKNIKSIKLSDCTQPIIYRIAVFEYFRQSKNFPYRGTIIKDISAHLIISRFHTSWQSIIFIIRNPISVALSKENYGEWHSAADIDNLVNYSTEINSITRQCFSDGLISSKFLEYIFIWSLINRIALKQMEHLGFSVVFYENLLRTPEESFEELFCLAGLQKIFTNHKTIILQSSRKQSKTTAAQNTLDTDKTDEQPWLTKISSQELDSAYKILKIFDLYDIYQDTLMPKVCRSELRSIVNRWK